MRPASLYYLTQAWPSNQRRQSKRGARATRRGRHAMPPRRNAVRELPAVARRVLASLTGSSQPA